MTDELHVFTQSQVDSLKADIIRLRERAEKAEAELAKRNEELGRYMMALNTSHAAMNAWKAAAAGRTVSCVCGGKKP